MPAASSEAADIKTGNGSTTDKIQVIICLLIISFLCLQPWRIVLNKCFCKDSKSSQAIRQVNNSKLLSQGWVRLETKVTVFYGEAELTSPSWEVVFCVEGNSWLHIVLWGWFHSLAQASKGQLSIRAETAEGISDTVCILCSLPAPSPDRF